MAARKNEGKPSKDKKAKKNIFARAWKAIVTFFKNIYTELKKVTWPTKKQLVSSTISVLAVCLVVGIIICASDALLELLFDAIRSF